MSACDQHSQQFAQAPCLTFNSRSVHFSFNFSVTWQVRAVEERRAGEASAKQQEVAELRALWQRMAEEQEQAEADDRERMRRLAAELQEFNRLRQAEMSERERRERWVAPRRHVAGWLGVAACAGTRARRCAAIWAWD